MASARSGLSVPETARRLGLSPSTVRLMIKKGLLRASRPSGNPRGHQRVAEVDVERRLAEQDFELGQPA